mmetsp:Transcript_45634/g.51086  ORF Transcript_45634/g.51086 Transcript_45634/m.51086 type:complete len:81 (+) Transcript_45634:296-538(+)
MERSGTPPHVLYASSVKLKKKKKKNGNLGCDVEKQVDQNPHTVDASRRDRCSKELFIACHNGWMDDHREEEKEEEESKHK